MTIWRTRYAKRTDFLDDYESDAGCGTVRLPITKASVLNHGCSVILDVYLQECRLHVLLRGYISRYIGPPPGTKRGLRAAVSIFERERLAVDFLMRQVQATDDEVQSERRKKQRIPVALTGRWKRKHESDYRLCTCDDISPGGAFLVSDHLEDVGTVLPIELCVNGFEVPLPLQAKVRHVHTGDDGTRRGMGCRFSSRDTGGNRRIKEIIRRVQAPIAHEPLEGIGNPVVEEFSRGDTLVDEDSEALRIVRELTRADKESPPDDADGA